MTDVVSFRPSAQESEIIERARRQLGARSRAEAVRLLVRKGGARLGTLRDDPVAAFRVPPRYRGGPTLTSRKIDEALYGGDA